MKTLNLRPHHLLCLSREECPGGWYNSRLKKHITKIRKSITKNPDLAIKIIKKCDDICSKCPHIKNGVCNKRKNINYWIIVMDNKVLRKLKIKDNSKHKAKDIFRLTIKKISNRDLRNICKGCEFLKYCLKFGINKSLIKAENEN